MFSCLSQALFHIGIFCRMSDIKVAEGEFFFVPDCFSVVSVKDMHLYFTLQHFRSMKHKCCCKKPWAALIQDCQLLPLTPKKDLRWAFDGFIKCSIRFHQPLRRTPVLAVCSRAITQPSSISIFSLIHVRTQKFCIINLRNSCFKGEIQHFSKFLHHSVVELPKSTIRMV